MEDKKQHILKKIVPLYMKHGIKSVTMDDVATEFGISKKTLYQYFKDKETLVSQSLDYFMANPIYKFNKNAENAIEEVFSIREHVIKVFKHYNNNLEYDLKKLYPSIHKKLHNFKREKIFRETQQNIEAGIPQGLYRPELDSAFVARLHVGRVLCTFNPENEIFGEDEAVSQEVFDKVIDYHFHAICTEKGLKEYRKQLNKVRNEKQN